MPEYDFVPLTKDHYPMIRDWLREPHIGGWWGNPDEEVALMKRDLNDSPVDMRVVALDGVPFAFVQDYPAHHWPMPQYADLPEHTRAVDTFLGDPAYLGKGHASGYLRQRARALSAAYPCIVVDPDPNNHRAVATYAKAGFQGTEIRPCEDGDPVRVMIFSEETA
jgi:aminoglycoside 6'-N-acetyltransferase